MKRFTWWRMEQNAPHNARERWCASCSILHHVKRFMSHSPYSLGGNVKTPKNYWIWNVNFNVNGVNSVQKALWEHVSIKGIGWLINSKKLYVTCVILIPRWRRCWICIFKRWQRQYVFTCQGAGDGNWGWCWWQLQSNGTGILQARNADATGKNFSGNPSFGAAINGCSNPPSPSLTINSTFFCVPFLDKY